MAVALVENRASAIRVLHRPGTVEADLSCMMCGRQVGQIVDGRVVHRAGCGGQLRIERGMLRCCSCGGSVYREPASVFAPR